MKISLFQQFLGKKNNYFMVAIYTCIAIYIYIINAYLRYFLFIAFTRKYIIWKFSKKYIIKIDREMCIISIRNSIVFVRIFYNGERRVKKRQKIRNYGFFRNWRVFRFLQLLKLIWRRSF